MKYIILVGITVFICSKYYKPKIKQARDDGYNKGYQDAHTDAFEKEVNNYVPKDIGPMPYDYKRSEVIEAINKIKKDYWG